MTTTQREQIEPGENATTATPTQTLISYQRVNPAAIAQLALTERVMDGSLPCVFMRYPDLPENFPFPLEDPARFLPHDAIVTRTAESKYCYEVFGEGSGYVVNLELSPNGARITVAATTHDIARQAGLEIAANFPEVSEGADEVELVTWRRTADGEAKTSEKKIKAPSWAEIATNYPQPTGGCLDDLIRMTPDQDLDQRGRIILWHGHPGTGKTSAIRALMREWSPWCQSELLMDPEMVFDDPNYLHEVIIRPAKSKLGESGPRYRLLVAEDADRYLQAGTHLRNNPALDRLLNVADGILGQGSNVIVLLTTNSNIAALHPALTRPGRCLAITEFERFDQAAARKWLGTLASAPSGASTLAELFELVRGTGRLGGLDEVRLGQYL